jgi:hypothetical protein
MRATFERELQTVCMRTRIEACRRMRTRMKVHADNLERQLQTVCMRTRIEACRRMRTRMKVHADNLERQLQTVPLTYTPLPCVGPDASLCVSACTFIRVRMHLHASV